MEEEIKQEFKKQEKRFDDLMEFLVENMATKDDIKNMATKDDITRLEAKLDAKIDAKIDATESNLMQEIRTIDLSIKEIKDDINKLEKRIGEDIDAYAEDILDLRKRVKVLEQNQLEMA